jgi:hypothetical protein
MIRPLGERVPVPSRPILGLAERLEEEARRLARFTRESPDLDLGRLWRRLAMWSTSVAHMATSGPASHDAALREFPEHPDHDRARDDAMIEFEALTDVIAFLAVGDMVLAELAATFLGRWQVAYADDNPWRDFLREVDRRLVAGEEPGPLRAARELDLDLREARNRIAAHRRRTHGEILSWDFDDVLTIDLVDPSVHRVDRALLLELGVDPTEIPETAPEGDGRNTSGMALDMLEAANVRLEATAAAVRGRGLPARPVRRDTDRTSRMHDLFDRLHVHAGLVDEEGRRLVRNAHRIAGYESVSPIRIVGASLRITAAISGARDQLPALADETP